jgi:hypothetical protein
VGTPGIGKTVTTPLLIRMLLQRGATVVYRIAGMHYGDGWLYEFVPSRLSSTGKYTCYAYPAKMGCLGAMASLCLKRSYYIVDTGDSEISYNPSVAFRPKVVIVATPDERHFGSGFLKMRGSGDDRVCGKMMYYPLWSLAELEAARRYFNDLSFDIKLFSQRATRPIP